MRKLDFHLTKMSVIGALCLIGVAGSFARNALADNAWPVKVHIDVSAEGHNAHTVWLRDPQSPLSHLELRVTPLFNNEDEVIGWDVELLRFSEQTGNPGPNLLAPRGNWHGWQSFMIRPTDLEERRREILRDDFRCLITILGSQTKPSLSIPGLTVFESLQLGIELNRTGSPRPKDRAHTGPKGQ